MSRFTMLTVALRPSAAAEPSPREPAAAGPAFGDGVGDMPTGTPQIGDFAVDALHDRLEPPQLAGLARGSRVVGAQSVDDLVEGEPELLQRTRQAQSLNCVGAVITVSRRAALGLRQDTPALVEPHGVDGDAGFGGDLANFHAAPLTLELGPEFTVSGMENTNTIACDMSTAPDTPAGRIAEYGRLFAEHLAGREHTARGIRFRLRAGEGVAAWVSDLSAREKVCCPFADFEVTTTADGEVRWDIRVPDNEMARALLEEIYRMPERTGGDWQAIRRRLGEIGFAVTTS